MSKLRAWWARVPDGIRVAMALFGFASLVATTTWTARDVWGNQAALPARVGKLESRVDLHSAQIDSLRARDAATNARLDQTNARLDRILCLLEAQIGVRPVSECVR